MHDNFGVMTRFVPFSRRQCIFFNEQISTFGSTISQHLAQMMAWYRAGDKQLLEPIMAYFIDAYMRCVA